MDTYLVRFGRLLFGISLTAFGALHFIYGDFVTRVVPSWPAWIPPRWLWAALVGTVLVAAGAAVITSIKPRPALAGLAGLLVLSIALLHLPSAAQDVFIGGTWTGTGKALVLLGGCAAVATTYPRNTYATAAVLDPHGSQAAGRLCLAAFMILAGAQHFRWTDFVVTLVPGWVPGGGPFWTYCSAVLLIAGGLGMMIPATARPAAFWSGVMIFLWVLMLHVPRAVQGVGSRSNETTAVFEALGFSGLAFLYAATSARASNRASRRRNG